MLQYNFNSDIFKAYDIRGKVAEDEICAEAAFFIGICLGKLINAKNIAVGCDARKSSLLLKQNLIEGIVTYGSNVIDIGLVPTPVCYFSVPFLEVDASVMITGSHNPENYNGFKITLKNTVLSGEELRQFISIAKNGIEPAGKKGSIRNMDIIENYISSAFKSCNFKNVKKLKIGIDAMNGSGGETLRQIITQLNKMTEVEFIMQNITMTGDFEKILPEPSKPSNVLLLKQFLTEHSLDIVFAFDGDADRVFMITRDKVWYGDDLTLLLSYIILPNNKGKNIIFDVKSSIVLEDEIKKLGGKPLIYKTGHSLIKKEMQKTGAILAGEMSGHIYINDGKFYPFDDGIYCFLRILEAILQMQDLPSFPKTFKTPEIKIFTDDKLNVLNSLKDKIKLLNPTKILEIDGIRAYFDGPSMVVARSSNTEDAIIVRIESYVKKEFDFLVKSLNFEINAQ